MDADSFHKILVPYLEATGLFVVVLGIAAAMIKRDGDRHKSEEREP